MAFATKATSAHSSMRPNVVFGLGQHKDCPFYTHCKNHGHTMEKCYKLHGYPVGHKARPRDGSATVNAIQQQQNSSKEQNFFQTLSSDQYQQLMSMLSS